MNATEQAALQQAAEQFGPRADRIDVLADLRDYADAKAAAYLRGLDALPKQASADQLAMVAKLKAAADAAASTLAAVAELIEALRNSPCYCEDASGDGDAITCDRCRAIARAGGAA